MYNYNERERNYGIQQAQYMPPPPVTGGVPVYDVRQSDHVDQRPQLLAPAAAQSTDAPFSADIAGFGSGLVAPLMSNSFMRSAALQYGQEVLGSKTYQKASKFISLDTLRYYFAVDTSYVLQKLQRVTFPYASQNWCPQYNTNAPIQPRHDVNVPDLYVPCMAFITYVLIAGLLLGYNERFSPESLGIEFSSALLWQALEVSAIWLYLYVSNISHQFKFLDIFALTGYKFVSLNLILMSSAASINLFFYLSFFYFTITCSLFMFRSIRVVLEPVKATDTYTDQVNNQWSSLNTTGRKRKNYLLLAICLWQPVILYFHSRHLVF